MESLASLGREEVDAKNNRLHRPYGLLKWLLNVVQRAGAWTHTRGCRVSRFFIEICSLYAFHPWRLFLLVLFLLLFMIVRPMLTLRKTHTHTQMGAKRRRSCWQRWLLPATLVGIWRRVLWKSHWAALYAPGVKLNIFKNNINLHWALWCLIWFGASPEWHVNVWHLVLVLLH